VAPGFDGPHWCVQAPCPLWCRTRAAAWPEDENQEKFKKKWCNIC
jgi:hypothetical protein